MGVEGITGGAFIRIRQWWLWRGRGGIVVEVVIVVVIGVVEQFNNGACVAHSSVYNKKEFLYIVVCCQRCVFR